VVPPGWLEVVSVELVGGDDVLPLGSEVVDPCSVTGVPVVVVVGAAVVVVVHTCVVVVVPPPGVDVVVVVDPTPETGVVSVVVVAGPVDVVVAAVVVVAHTSVVVVGGAVVVVVELASVVAGASVVLVVGGAVVVAAAVVDVEAGAPVVVVASVVGVVDVLGACDVEVVDDVLTLQFESRSTDVLCVSVKLSGHTACTVSVMVPLVPPGTSDVANVVPPSVTGFAYPVTGYVCAPIDATAVSIVMTSVVSLLPIDQCTT
jgi:hypothetical protein